MKQGRTLALLWALVVCLLLGHNVWLWMVQRIAPGTDIMALLPVQERDPVLQQSFTHMVDAAQQRVVVLVGAPQWNDALRAADAYSVALAARPDLLTATPADEQTQADWLALFQRHRTVLLTAAQEQQLRTQPPQFWVQAALQKLYSPFGGPKLGAWRDDPFGLFGGWLQQRAQETPVRPRDGHLYVSDGQRQYVLLALTLKVPALSMTAQDTVLPLLAAAGAAAHQLVPQAELIQAGVILHAAAASSQASGEVSTIGIGSLLGVLLLFWFSFHSLKPIALILLSIAIGCLGALSVCWLLFGQVHLMTLVFGASLTGVAQDYGIYFLYHRLGADARLDSRALLKRLMPGLVLTLLSTVIGYLGLALTPFPGLRQMAVFSGLGLVFAWLTVVCWFPPLIGGGALRGGALLRRYGALLARWPLLRVNRATLLGAALLAAAAAAGIARLGANDDIRLLQNPPRQLVEDQLKLSKLLDAPTPVQYFLVRGASADQVLQREETLKRRLDPLIELHAISGYQAMSNWVPSAATQAARRALLEDRLLNAGGALDLLAAQTGADQAWLAATRAALRGATAPLTLDQFLATPASEPWRHLWLGQGAGGYASIVALRGLSGAALPQLRQAGAGLPGVQWVDKVAEISAVLGRYRQDMGWVVLAAYAVVFLLLLPRYRGRTWRVLAPAAVASIATLALLGLAGQKLQLFHVLALMLLLGVGVDYGIFMQEQPRRANQTPWLAVGMSAANTILSFGLLGLSHTPALQSFGLTMLLGTALAWLIVPYFCSTNESSMPEAFKSEAVEILIIGAGPAGAVAAALLRQQGRQVLVIEREQFPRFSIGESLLPQSMAYLEQAGMLQAVVEAGFQYKNGAAFVRDGCYTDFDFRDKFSSGWGTTYQVQRASFDHLLAKEAERFGAEVRYRHEVTQVQLAQDGAPARVSVRDADGAAYQIEPQFILDASGFGRILPRLLKLETPSDFPVRGALFTHIEDGIADGAFDRNKIRVTVHPRHTDVWFWTIPFAGGRCSLGVVAATGFLERYSGTPTERLQAIVAEDPSLRALLANAKWDTPARQIVGYAANVERLWGEGYALLGNAGEFLDPVFSSGVTIAFKSASLAAAALRRRYAGETVDWQADFGAPLRKGIDTFRAFVESWYAGGFQDIIFHPDQQPEVRRMISSILAGYAWDLENPYVKETARRLAALEALCAPA